MGEIIVWVFRQASVYVGILLILAVAHYFNAHEGLVIRQNYCGLANSLKQERSFYDDRWGGADGWLRRMWYKQEWLKAKTSVEEKQIRADGLWEAVAQLEPNAQRDGYCIRFRDSPTAEQQVSFPLSVAEQKGSALMWWATLLALPYLLRSFIYYVLAPRANAGAPVAAGLKQDERAVSEADAATKAPGKISSATLAIQLLQGESALVKANYVRSAGSALLKGTMWQLDWRRPLMGLAAGLNALSKYQTTNDTTAELTLIPAENEHDEMAIAEIPPGRSMVVYPRALVGVIVPRNGKVKITSDWRLGSIQAWLTLSLRLLSFHGPLKIIVRGSKGITLHRAGLGLDIHRSATLAYSANLGLSCRRTEPFGAYLLNKQPLFEDHFQTAIGTEGYVVAEVVPRGTAATDAPKKGLEALVDVFLKALGI